MKQPDYKKLKLQPKVTDLQQIYYHRSVAEVGARIFVKK